MPIVRGAVKRGASCVGSLIRVGPYIDERAHHRLVPLEKNVAAGGDVHRRLAVAVRGGVQCDVVQRAMLQREFIDYKTSMITD